MDTFIFDCISYIFPFHINRLFPPQTLTSILFQVSLEQLDFICEALNCELDELIVRVPNKTPKIVHTKNSSVISL